MARILVFYGTTDGQTAKIAAAIGDELRAGGGIVDVVDAAGSGSTTRPDDYDAVIVAASVHASGYQKSVQRWVTRHSVALGGRRSAFVSVCLGVLEKKPEVDRALAEIRRKFFDATGWQPQTTHVVAGALLYRRYNFLKRWTMRRIVARAHGDTDTSRNYEYTDWDDVKAFARAFGAGVRGATERGAEG